MIKINDLQNECSSTEVGLSIETLMEEIKENKAVVSEKLEFENRDKSKLIVFFGISGRSGT